MLKAASETKWTTRAVKNVISMRIFGPFFCSRKKWYLLQGNTRFVYSDANDVVLFAISLRLQAHYRELLLERRREKLWKQKRIIHRAVEWPPKMRVYRQLFNFTCCPHNPWVTVLGEGEGVNWRICCGSIGHFRAPPALYIKTRLGTQPLIWKWYFILMQIKLISTRKVEHLTSFWYRGPGELGNGLSYPWFKCYFLLCFVFGEDYDNVW